MKVFILADRDVAADALAALTNLSNSHNCTRTQHEP